MLGGSGVWPTALAALAQFPAGGWQALLMVPVALVFGLLLVELLLRDWQRIAFTCVYVPGHRVLAHTAWIAMTGYLVFTVVGVALTRAVAASPLRTGAVLLTIMAVAGVMRWRRLRRWRETSPCIRPYAGPVAPASRASGRRWSSTSGVAGPVHMEGRATADRDHRTLTFSATPPWKPHRPSPVRR